MALNLEPDNVGVVIFGNDRAIKKVFRKKNRNYCKCSCWYEELLGRVVRCFRSTY